MSRKNKHRIQKENHSILNTLAALIRAQAYDDHDLDFSDIQKLCGTDKFSWSPSERSKLDNFFSSPLGATYKHKEFSLWLKLLRKKLRAVDVAKDVNLFFKSDKSLPSLTYIKVQIRQENFRVLFETFNELQDEIDQLITSYNEQMRKLKDAEIHAAHQEFLASQVRKREEERLIRAIQTQELAPLRINSLGLYLPRFPANYDDFEHICRDWLEAWGDSNVFVTKASGDAGIDVESDNCVAQAKFYSGQKVGRPELQQLAGAAIVSGKIKVFFAFNGYTNEALQYSDEDNVWMCLFNFNVTTISFDPVNTQASSLIAHLANFHLPKLAD
jgi:hypothetical protein